MAHVGDEAALHLQPRQRLLGGGGGAALAAAAQQARRLLAHVAQVGDILVLSFTLPCTACTTGVDRRSLAAASEPRVRSFFRGRSLACG